MYQPDFWTPIVDQAQIEGSYTLDDRGQQSALLIGRLKPDVSVAQATADLNAVGAYLKKTYPTNDDGITFSLVRPGLMGNMLGGPVRAFVAGLMLLAGLILLAACANLGSLFAARAADRSREIALRMALGSTRRRILRQLLTEALLVAFAGGAAGIAASVLLLRALSAWQPLPQFPVNVPVNPDARTYVVAVLLAIVSGLLCGLSPVRQVLRAAPWEVVKTGTAIAGRSKRFALRDVLLVVQVAVCAVLLTSSLVAVRGLVRSLSANFGFQPHHALLLTQDLNMAGYKSDRGTAMQRRILDAADAVPGVASAGLVDNIPLGLGWSQTAVFKSGTTDFRDSNATAISMAYGITPGYLRAAGTTLLAGRDIAWSDDKNAPAVALVNREFARKFFGSVANAVGAHFLHDRGHDNFLVIGVVEDGKYVTLTEDPKPAFFRPLLQSPSPETVLVARTSADPNAVAPALHDAIRALDAGLPFTHLGQGTGQRALRRPRGHRRTGRVGPVGCNARNHRHLRHGQLLRQQAPQGNGHPHRPRCRKSPGARRRSGSRLPPARLRIGGRHSARAGRHKGAGLHRLPGLTQRSRCAGWNHSGHDGSGSGRNLGAGPSRPAGRSLQAHARGIMLRKSK
jgi:predicted permease